MAIMVLVPHSASADARLLKKGDGQITTKKYKAAIRTITKAMNSGSLSGAGMARALYRRGVAYNESGRQSSAIADLTGALWLKKLDGAAQKDAYRHRASAYEATGYKTLARNDYSRSGPRAVGRTSSVKKPTIAKAYPPVPGFNTVVRAAKRTAPAAAKKTTAKRKAVKKAAVPAFRTTIAAD